MIPENTVTAFLEKDYLPPTMHIIRMTVNAWTERGRGLTTMVFYGQPNHWFRICLPMVLTLMECCGFTACPGIGKSAIAHSICSRLDAMKQLGGVSFAYGTIQLAQTLNRCCPLWYANLQGCLGRTETVWWRHCVKAPQLIPQLASGELFLNSLQSLEAHPPGVLVLVIDALDEYGHQATRKQLLGHLSKAYSRNKWVNDDSDEIKYLLVARRTIFMYLRSSFHNAFYGGI